MIPSTSPRVCAVGDNVLDRYPDRGLMYPGGQSFNVAVWASRAGARSGYVGVLGSDAAGDLLRGVLDKEGVDATRVRHDPRPNSYSTVYLVDGDRTFGADDVELNRFELDSDDLGYLARYDLVHVSESSFMEAQLHRIAAVARISYDFSIRPADYAEPLLGSVHTATFSGSQLTRAEIIDLIGWAHQGGVQEVLVTRGEHGAIASTGGDLFETAAAPAEVVDTLGAGDAFTAGYLVARASGRDVDLALGAGARIAAKTCADFGAVGYPTALPDPVSG